MHLGRCPAGNDGYARRVRRVALYLAVGLVPGLLSAIQMWALDPGLTLAAALAWQVPPWLAWIALAPAVVALAHRFPLERTRWRASLPVHVVACGAAAIAHAAFSWWVWRWIHPFLPDVPPITAIGILARKFALLELLVYASVVAAAHALAWRVAAAELEGRLARAQLDALKTQLHPHFLFNTLHAVSVLVRKGDGDAAVRALADLGGLLRLSLDAAGEQEVALERELAFVARYLDLEKLRFGDRLGVAVDVDPDTLTARVPNLLLQPLVENAVKHGLAGRTAAGMVTISAHRRGAVLELAVRDDGAGPASGWERAGGVGLANVRARLARLHPGRHTFALEPAPGGGTVARVTLPLERAP